MAEYTKRDLLKTVVFVIFVVIWVTTRIYVFPCHIIYSSIYELLLEVQPNINAFIGYAICNSLLLVLLVLNVIWTWSIFRIVLDVIANGTDTKDVRSDSEPEESNDSADAKENNNMQM